MEISPDQIVFFEWGFIKLSATIVYTWGVIIVLSVISWLATRNITSKADMSRWQNALEAVISYMRSQIADVMQRKPDKYLPLIGALYLFIAVSNFLSFLPVYEPPTASIQTTSMLAGIVFFAVPVYGIMDQGWGYFKHYAKPSPIMLPFNVLGEFTRTLALAVRLFGNVMSGTLIIGILLSVAPLIFPVLMESLELLIGQIQAYIFAVLATVYIGSAIKAHDEKQAKKLKEENS